MMSNLSLKDGPRSLSAGAVDFLLVTCSASQPSVFRLQSNSPSNFGVVGAIDLTNRRCLTQSMVIRSLHAHMTFALTRT